MPTTQRDSHAAPGGVSALAGRPVARIGLGVMQLGSPTVDHDRAVAILRRAVETGIDHLDTAEFYGRANDLIRDALAPYPQNLVLATKVGAERREPGGLVAAQRPEQLRAQVEANLASLGVDRIDVVNLRRADQQPGIIAEGDQVVDLDDQLAALIELREAGSIGAIGLSNVSADQVRRALPAGIGCVQNHYNLLERSAEPLLELCAERDIRWVPFFPLGSGFPGARRVIDHPEVIRIAAAIDATPAQVGLAWQLAHSETTLLIAGTADPHHVDENVAAGSIELPAEAITALDALARP